MTKTRKLPANCQGEIPLMGRMEPWMTAFLQREDLNDLLNRYGSPLNVISTAPMVRNIGQLNRAAQDHELDFRVYFARKANKCLSFINESIQQKIGIDTASENEIRQSLDVGADPADLICTAAVKSESLLKLCIHQKICIAVDNHDEIEAVSTLARQTGTPAIVALRIGGFDHDGKKLPTRFGFDATGDIGLVSELDAKLLTVQGVHFHLDGYDAKQRVSAITQSLRWVKHLRSNQHPVTFIDMGGGLPISYLDDEHQWSRFWTEHDQALLGHRPPITYRNHALGKHVYDGKVIGTANSYPYYQTPVRADWLANILDGIVEQETIASLLRSANVQLRCEPGRGLLDGCGMTIARVEFRKRNSDGDWLIGLSMNRTQCRTSSDDFLVDPILVPTSHPSDDAMAGYLVGAYCTESELITQRRMQFPRGVRRGYLIAFPNTAGYLMHFLESRSHQFPLAKNVVVDEANRIEIDPIEFATC